MIEFVLAFAALIAIISVMSYLIDDLPAKLAARRKAEADEVERLKWAMACVEAAREIKRRREFASPTPEEPRP